MSKELTKNLMCVVIRGGIEIWIEKEKIDPLAKAIERKEVIRIGNNIINSVDISGIFEAQVMEEHTRRKNGQWRCDYGFWHKKFEECAHRHSDKKND
jgi:ribosomal protein L19E